MDPSPGRHAFFIPKIYERLHHNLRELQLVTIDEILDASLERASREGTPVLEILDSLVEEEKRRRENQKCSLPTIEVMPKNWESNDEERY